MSQSKIARHELSATLTKIDSLINGLATAEQRKASVSRYYNDLRVGFDTYGNRTVPDVLVDAAQRANEIIRAQLVEAVEQEFRDKAKAVAAEIDSLRVILPQLAAKAAVELGPVVLDIAARSVSLPLSKGQEEGNG